MKHAEQFQMRYMLQREEFENRLFYCIERDFEQLIKCLIISIFISTKCDMTLNAMKCLYLKKLLMVTSCEDLF